MGRGRGVEGGRGLEKKEIYIYKGEKTQNIGSVSVRGIKRQERINLDRLRLRKEGERQTVAQLKGRESLV